LRKNQFVNNVINAALDAARMGIRYRLDKREPKTLSKLVEQQKKRLNDRRR
jgi:hypothetical protein